MISCYRAASRKVPREHRSRGPSPSVILGRLAQLQQCAMSVTMLRLPLTSVLQATLLLASDGLAVTPLVIVAAVIGRQLRQPDARRQSGRTFAILEALIGQLFP